MDLVLPTELIINILLTAKNIYAKGVCKYFYNIYEADVYLIETNYFLNEYLENIPINHLKKMNDDKLMVFVNNIHKIDNGKNKRNDDQNIQPYFKYIGFTNLMKIKIFGTHFFDYEFVKQKKNYNIKKPNNLYVSVQILMKLFINDMKLLYEKILNLLIQKIEYHKDVINLNIELMINMAFYNNFSKFKEIYSSFKKFHIDD